MENFNNADRQNIHQVFWNLVFAELQREYLSSWVDEYEKESIRTKSENPGRKKTVSDFS